MTADPQVFHWLLLHRLPGVYPASIRKLALANSEQNPEEWLNASPSRLRAARLGEAAVVSIVEWQRRPQACAAADAARRDQDWLATHGVELLHLRHPLYPPLLLEISDPPPLLYAWGDLDCLAQPQLAVVGSRRPSRQGLSDAAVFAGALAESGFAVTSGLAYGIDAAAHRAALDAPGKTVAVLGTGLDVIYPSEHARLAEEIRESGVLLTELSLGSPPRAVHFPSRNRIISGLSVGVLVVEAALQSGSLVTARLALEQNREVFAIPGSIHSPVSRGCNALIRNGATLVQEVQDVLDELGGWSRAPSVPSAKSVPPIPVLAADEAAVFAAVGFQPTPLDLIMESVTQPLPTVLALLGELELMGLVENRAGSYQRATG